MSATISASAVQAAGEVRVVFGRVTRRLKELADKDDLTPSQSSVLSRLDKTARRRPASWRRPSGCARRSMAAILSALRAADLIERHPDPPGRPSNQFRLADHDRPAPDPGVDRRVRQEWLAQALQDNCTEAERQTIVKALALLDTALEAAASR